MEPFDYMLRPKARRAHPALSLTGPRQGEAVHRFHATIPGYRPTALHALDHLAGRLGLEQIWVKDESQRFGLNAFKALGGSWAMANCLAGRLGVSIEELDFPRLCAPPARRCLGELTFVTATDGNHGRGVAWAARMLGHKAVVYMPRGSAPERLENIRAQGAQADLTDLNYDEAVRLAAQKAQENGWIMMQDTAWPGYEEIPARIMEGYVTLAHEIAGQLEGEVPTHLFLQAGVGSFAGAVLGYFAALWGERRPITLVLEPDRADCHFRTAQADDGTLHFVTGDMDSTMAGLCCGEPCTLSWPILDAYADGFVSCGDGYSDRGMRLLGRPEGGDPAIVSGESGAVGAGVLDAICGEERLAELKEALDLGKNSRVLLISTEGDTDSAHYRRVLEDS